MVILIRSFDKLAWFELLQFPGLFIVYFSLFANIFTYSTKTVNSSRFELGSSEFKVSML